MPRQIQLDGCLNFRDLGGYPTADGGLVRWGLVFRSDALHLLSRSDVARLRDEIGLQDIIDLRSTIELETDGRGPLAREEMRFHHVPLFDSDTTVADDRLASISLGDRYFLLAEFASRPIARVVTTLARTDAAAVYHCAAGKDRTGVISAILLGLLEVAAEVIVADYALTRDNLEAIIDRLTSTEGYRHMLAQLPPDTLHAEPETMATFLDRIAGRYGSMAGYAEAIGVAAADVDRLRARLVERS
jgi:protein tyrosine/serine phosphatase